MKKNGWATTSAATLRGKPTSSAAEADGHGAAADHVLAMQPRTPNQNGVSYKSNLLSILRLRCEPANSLPLRQDRLCNSEPALHRTSLGGLSETTCLLTVRSEGNKIATRQRGGSKPVSAVPSGDQLGAVRRGLGSQMGYNEVSSTFLEG